VGTFSIALNSGNLVGMDIYEIRKSNLIALIGKRRKGACADKWGMSAAHLSQILSDKTDKNLGDDVARRIEERDGLPRGWLDQLHSGEGEYGRLSQHVNVEGEPRHIREGMIPVVGMAQLGTDGFFDAMEYPVGYGDGYLKIFSDDPNAYALKVVGNSMEPRIRSGEFVLVEPNKTFVAGDEVLVRTISGQSMIKVFMYARDGLIRLLSVNDAHPPITIADDEVDKIHFVGAIVKSSRYIQR